MNVFGIIPARYASTRFPGKPLVKIQGKTMVEWVYCRAKQAFSTVAVATDDTRIADEVKRFGGTAVITSPLHNSGTDRCAEALILMQEHFGKQADVVVNVQGDEPFVDSDLLVRLAHCFEDPSTQIATVVRRFTSSSDLFNPNCVKAVMTAAGRAIYFSRSPIPYIRGCEQEKWIEHHNFFLHLGLYAYRADVLNTLTQLPQSTLELAESLEQNRWLENDFYIKVIQTDHETYGIDTPEDLERVHQLLSDKHISI